MTRNECHLKGASEPEWLFTKARDLPSAGASEAERPSTKARDLPPVGASEAEWLFTKARDLPSAGASEAERPSTKARDLPPVGASEAEWLFTKARDLPSAGASEEAEWPSTKARDLPPVGASEEAEWPSTKARDLPSAGASEEAEWPSTKARDLPPVGASEEAEWPSTKARDLPPVGASEEAEWPFTKARDLPPVGASEEAEWPFTKARVAAAVIKNKPPGMSGREHAEQLARRLKGRDERWEERARGLQQEVLRLQQELLIVRVTASRTSSAEAVGHGDTMDNASQDLFGPGSETCSADLQPGCGSETPELMQQDPQPATPPLPEPPAPSSPKPAIPHVQFLQSLCALHRVREGDPVLEPLWFGPDGGAGSLLADSVCQLLDSVVAACRDPTLPGTGEPVLQACRVAARAMDLFCSQRQPSAEFTGHVEASLRELTALLLHRDQLSRLQSSEELMECLITLGSSSMFTSFLIRHLLSLISNLADQLRQAFQVRDSSVLAGFPVVQYHNSCYLFWAVERLLQGSGPPGRLEAGSDRTGFLGRLDHVFLLSEEFPVFFICLWRLGCLLTSSADQSPKEPGPGPPATPF